jgi:hypothetical protein
VEVAVRASSGVGRRRGRRGGLKWSVLDAAGERGCEKVILSPLAGARTWMAPLPSGASVRDVPGLLRTWVEGGSGKRGAGNEGSLEDCPRRRRPTQRLDLRSGKSTR